MQTRFCFSQSVSIFGVFPLDMQFLHERSGSRFNTARSYSSGDMVFGWSFLHHIRSILYILSKMKKNGDGRKEVSGAVGCHETGVFISGGWRRWGREKKVRSAVFNSSPWIFLTKLGIINIQESDWHRKSAFLMYHWEVFQHAHRSLIEALSAY